MKRALVATFIVLVIPAAPASGYFDITIKDEPAFHGKINAHREACEPHRLINLFRKTPGKPPKRIGRDYTNNNGRWQVLEDQFTLKAGGYFVRAPRHSLKTGGFCQHRYSRNAVFVE
jgi:hypothetical protein